MSAGSRLLAWASTALATLTGAGLFWAKYLARSADPYSVVGHPLQPFWLKAHVLAAPLLVFALGWLATSHVAPRLDAGKGPGRKSGWTNLASGLPMVVSGYLLPVLTDRGAVRITVWVHVVTSLLYVGGFVAHLLAARRRRRGHA